MKSKLFFLAAFSMTVLLLGKVCAQNPYQYQFVLMYQGQPTDEYTMETEEEMGCYFPEQVYWPRDEVFQYLRDRHYDIRVRKPDGTLTFIWAYDISCTTTYVNEIDGCTDLYHRVFTVTNTNPDYDPYETGPLPIQIDQYIRFSLSAEAPEQAGQYLPTVTCNPGLDLEEAWTTRPENTTEALASYISGYGFEVPENGQGCWENMSITYSTPAEVPEEQSDAPGDCYRTFRMDYFFLNLPCNGGFSYYQYIHMPAPDFTVNFNTIANEMAPIFLGGCSENNAPAPLRKLSDFERYGVTFGNIMSERNIRIDCADITVIDEFGVNVSRTYTITDECTGHQKTINQFINMDPYLTVLGSHNLKTITYDENGLPEAYTDVKQLEDVGLRYKGCDVPLVSVLEEHDENYPPDHPDHVRVYKIYYENFPDVSDELTQRIEYRPKSAGPAMTLETQDLNCDRGEDGGAKLLRSEYDQGCPDCLNDNLWYMIEFVNHI